MTRFLLNVLLVLCISAAAAPALGDDGVRTIRMEVQGLVCGFCAQGIDAQMREFDATRDVYVNLERGLVAVELDPGADIADEVLDQALTDAGYTLGAISRVERPLAEVRDEVERDRR
jgi:mercuric ion binding protein